MCYNSNTLRKEISQNMTTRFLAISLFFILLLATGCSENSTNEPIPEPVRLTPTPTPILNLEPECDHFWKDADCFDPYLCYDCDETKGEPLEHYWSEANFQEAATCVNCGETEGEPLEPSFITRGLRINTTAGRPLRYRTITNPEPVVDAVGLATLMYIDIFESDRDHPERTGYEYIAARFMITFDDEQAGSTGFRYMTGQFDYFGFDPNERAIAHDELPESGIPEFRVANRRLNFHGREYEYFVKYSQIKSDQIAGTWYVVFEYVFLVPRGYDGIIVYVSNAANWTSASNRVLSDNFDSDTLFFRLRTQTN